MAYVTVLAAQPLAVTEETGDDVIAAVRQFAAAIRDIESFKASIDEAFVEGVAAVFEDKNDLEALVLLGDIGMRLQQGNPPRQIAGDLSAYRAGGGVPRSRTDATGSRQRAAVIGAAKKSYALERPTPGRVMVCSERAWVHTALRDAGMPGLIDAECGRFGITDAEPVPAGRTAVTETVACSGASGTADRAGIIFEARKNFWLTKVNKRKCLICSEKSWVNQALRDAGEPVLTDDEVTRHSIAVN